MHQSSPSAFQANCAVCSLGEWELLSHLSRFLTFPSVDQTRLSAAFISPLLELGTQDRMGKKWASDVLSVQLMILHFMEVEFASIYFWLAVMTRAAVSALQPTILDSSALSLWQ